MTLHVWRATVTLQKKFQHFEETVEVGTLPNGQKHDFEESCDDIIRPSEMLNILMWKNRKG